MQLQFLGISSLTQAAVNAKFNRDFEKHSDYFDKHIDNFEKHPEKIASTFYPIEEHED